MTDRYDNWATVPKKRKREAIGAVRLAAEDLERLHCQILDYSSYDKTAKAIRALIRLAEET